VSRKNSSSSNPNPNPPPVIKLPDYLVPDNFSGNFSLKNGGVGGRYLGTIKNGAGQGRTMENYLQASGASDAELRSYSLDGTKYVSADGNLANTGTKFSLFRDTKDASKYYLGNPNNKEQCFGAAGVFGKCIQDSNYQWELDSSPLDLYYPLNSFRKEGPHKFNISETDKCLLNTGLIGSCSDSASNIDYKIMTDNTSIQLKSSDGRCIVGEGEKLAFKPCDDKTYWKYNLKDLKDTSGLLSYSNTNMALDKSGKLVQWYTIAKGDNNYAMADPFGVHPGLSYKGAGGGYELTFYSYSVWDKGFFTSLIGKTIDNAVKVITGISTVMSPQVNDNSLRSDLKVKGISVEILNTPDNALSPEGNNYQYKLVFFAEDPLQLNFCSEFKGMQKEYDVTASYCETDPMYYTSRYIKPESEIRFNVNSLDECRKYSGKLYNDVLNDSAMKQKISYPTDPIKLEALRTKGALEVMDYTVDKNGKICSYVSQNDRLITRVPNQDCLKRPLNMFVYEKQINPNNPINATCNSYLNEFHL